MTRRHWLVLLLFLSAALGLAGGCSMAARAFAPDEAGQSDVTRAGQAISDVGTATGVPWLLAIGQVVTAVGAAAIAIRKARQADDEPLTAKQRSEVVAAMRAEGWAPPPGA